MRQTVLAALLMLAGLLGTMREAVAYTAVAVSGSLAYGFCNNMQSQGEADSCALSYCQQGAADPDTCAIGLRSEPTGNYALAIGGGSWGVAMGQSQADADRDALGYCANSACAVVARWTEGIVRGN
ncbi:hypothetical protein [Devosia sp.]|uniref:hypothetical protein n=1 Tax=Devosia sp. TaxID=1871048 RepID=UPI001ACEFF47|nr:hypothetical protein [Devosia sp.]MBN9308861.1 DUF4189 domain-containing protein [Devosia sp.]